MPRVDEEFRQLMLWLEAQARERSRAFGEWIARAERESERRHAEVMAGHARTMAELHELHEEDRAQRAALFQILDRLDGGGGAASA
jgi:hypothetical protein